VPPTRFAVLRYLVQRAGRLLTQNDLLEAACPKAYVEPKGKRMGGRPAQAGISSDVGPGRWSLVAGSSRHSGRGLGAARQIDTGEVASRIFARVHIQLTGLLRITGVGPYIEAVVHRIGAQAQVPEGGPNGAVPALVPSRLRGPGEQTRRDHFTNVTGTSTRCSTFVAIEPRSRPEMAPTAPEPRPRVPMMTWSQCRSRT